MSGKAQPINEETIKAKGRELESTKWELPQRFRLTADKLAMSPDELQKADPEMYRLYERTKEQQNAWAAQANSLSTRPSVQDVHRAQAVQMAEELALVIQRLKEQRNKIVTSGGEGDPAELQRAILALRQRRAESLSLCGRYDLAASESPNPEFRDHCLKILDAIWRDDEEDCPCEPIRGTGAHADIVPPKHVIKEEIYSLKHGAVVFLRSCARCGDLNVVDKVSSALLEQRSHRARAHQLAGTLAPAEAARVLTNQNHTSAKLLK